MFSNFNFCELVLVEARQSICLSPQISSIVYLINYKHLLVNDWYVYPDWAYTLGWVMSFSSVFVVMLFVVGQLCLTPGTFKQVSI